MHEERRGEDAATAQPASRTNRLWGSLAVRVVGMSSLWAMAAFLVVGGLISSLYERTALSGFEAVVRAQLFNLVNAVTVDKDGILRGVPDLGDLAYSQPLSGWYWEVLPASANTTGRLSSFSLGRARIADVPEAQAPFDMQYRRDYRVPGLDGETLYVEEAEVVLDSDNHAARFRVMGNASTLDADIAAFNRQLTLYLGLFGLGSTVINALAILYGLRPLSVVQRSLAAVRTGEKERLEGRFPNEIQPLAAEMNALVDSNRRIVERARTQVGNLAHALKTPVAVLLNEAGAIGGEKGRVLREQGERMQAHVQHYLDRARIAAGAESVIARTPVKPVVDRLVRVVGKLNPGFRVETRIAPSGERIVFAGEQQDLEEMLGNLLENAAKYGRSRILLALEARDAGSFAVSVMDDGPGLSPQERAEATKRGRRFDETVPGSGLGLSIVAETVLQYRGDFRLEPSEFGGLRAELILPRSLDAPIS